MNTFSSMRSRLILFVLLAATPALLLTLYSGLEQRRQAAEAAKSDAQRLVRLAANNEELLIENTRGFIIAMSHLLAPVDNDLSRCSETFSHMLDLHFPYFDSFYVSDLNGNILCHMASGDLPLDLLGCEHYQQMINSPDFVISKYHLCRNSGEPVISMGYPVRGADEQIIGVINISLDLNWLNDLATQANMPQGTTLTLLDRDGIILVHYPDSENWRGQVMPAESIGATILEQKEGTAEGLGTDGVDRLHAFMPLRGSQDSVFISIGIPTEAAYAEANRALGRNLALLILVTILALIAAWVLGDVFFMRQTQSLVHTTQRLASGDLGARSEISYEAGELGLLAQSFDHMAESLSHREAERDQAEEAMRAYAAELERSNRDLQDFANIASHDLQEPLRKIQTFGEILELRYAPVLDERGRDYLDRMRLAARRMQQLILDLLTYSRIETKGRPFERVNLADIVQQVLLDLDMQIEQSKANIEVGDLPVVEADPGQMQQLLSNLISNALKFQPHNGRPFIKVSGNCLPAGQSGRGRSKKPAERIQVCVSDNGIGFEEKYLDRIFQPFQRLHDRESYQGTGMGLAICRKIVERHGGAISARSKPGSGTTFVVELPVKQSPEEKVDEHEIDQYPVG
jgi:signal transduction histidine kinase